MREIRDDLIPHQNQEPLPTVPERKIHFFGQQDNGPAGKEVSVNKHFLWGDEEWYIPSVYVCGKGLVIDFLRKAPVDQIRAFMDKYHLGPDSDAVHFSLEMQQQIDADNPLVADIQPQADLNGVTLKSVGGSGYCWNPLFPKVSRDEAKSAVQHYGLDPECGWALHQRSFQWNTQRPPKLSSLSVTMVRQETAIPGPHFKAANVGGMVQFTHPLTNITHTLTVQEIEEQTVDVEQLQRDMEFPANCVTMAYTLTPKLPQCAIHVMDTVPSDRPRHKQKDPLAQGASTGVLVDGVTSVTAIKSSGGEVHTACSALHFETVKDIEWRIVFHEKLKEDLCVELI